MLAQVLRALMLLVMVSSLMVACASDIVLREIQRPASVAGVDRVEFWLQPGQTGSAIAQRLYEAGLIRHPVLFEMMLHSQRRTERLQAGLFRLSPRMTMGEIIATLSMEPVSEAIRASDPYD